MEHVKSNAQLMVRCRFNHNTGRVVLEDFTKYFPTLQGKRLF